MNEELMVSLLRKSMVQQYEACLDVPKHSFSPAFERKMDRLIRRERAWSWRFTNTAGKCAALALVCLVLMLTGVFAVSANAREEFSKEYQRIMQEIQAISIKQNHAAAANDRIMKSFSCDENGMYIYPDDFAGTYHDGEHLVLCLKRGSGADAVNKYLNIVGNKAEYLRIREVEYSLNELQAIADSQARELNKQSITIYSYWVDIENNGICFTTEQKNVEMLTNLFRNAYANIVCHVEAGEAPSLTTDYYYGGNTRVDPR